jgi:glycine cleavage system H protein
MITLRFTKTHEWLQSVDEEVIIGITDHAQQLLGDLVFIELPAVGDVFQAGEELGVVESVKAASDFYAPISGVVTAVNPEVAQNPAMVNSHPESQGWLVKLKPSNVQEIDTLLNIEQYLQTVAKDH